MSTILITGASSGLGAEMARQFAAKGHDLALCARRTDRLEELRDEILAAPPRAAGWSCAPRRERRRAGLRGLPRVPRRLRRLDRVIVNAGLGKGAPSAPAATTPTARPR
jgi:NADP-dependent 3-hydroxy acid dehydrogenase YdfG